MKARRPLFLILILISLIFTPVLSLGKPAGKRKGKSQKLGSLYEFADTEILWVSEYTADLQNWDERNAPSPYLADESIGYIHEAKTSGATEGYFGFEDPTGNGTINLVTLNVECYGDDTNDRIDIWLDCSDGLGWVKEGTITVDQLSYDWETLSFTTRLDSWADIQNAQIYLSYLGVGGADDLYVRRAYLSVDYEFDSDPEPEPEPDPLGASNGGHYGENETYLGQIVDEYINDDNIQSTYNAVHNVTLECMEIQDYEVVISPNPIQVLFGGFYDLLSPVDIEYNSLGNGYIWAADHLEDWRARYVSTDGIIKNLRVVLDGSPGIGNHYTFTLMLNTVPTALTFDIIDSETSGSNMVNEITVTGGDRISLQCDPDGTPTARYATWTSVFEGDTEKESLIMGGSGFALSNSAIEYVQVMGGSNYGITELNYREVIPTSGTIKNLYVFLSDDPGKSGDAYRFTLRKGGASQSLTVTITEPDTTGNDLVNSFTVIAGDVVTMMVEPLNTPQIAPYANWGMTFVSDINGESILLGATSNNLPDVDTEYNSIIPSQDLQAWTISENEHYALGQNCILKKFHVLLAGSPGAGNKYDFTVRLGGSDSNIVTTISDDETSGDSGVLEDVVALDEYATLKVVPTGSPTIRDAYWGMVCYIAIEEAPFGLFYTKEMLDGDVALNLMYNVSIPENTGMTMELSEDNSTWVDHNNQTGYETLIAGFESVDLRDLNTSILYFRFNMTGDGISTPRFCQLRLVTITNVTLNGNGNGEIVYVYRPEGWVLTIMIAAIGVPLIILGTRRRRR